MRGEETERWGLGKEIWASAKRSDVWKHRGVRAPGQNIDLSIQMFLPLKNMFKYLFRTLKIKTYIYIYIYIYFPVFRERKESTQVKSSLVSEHPCH